MARVQKMINRNLCKTVISSGGTITPLLINPIMSKGLGLMNPSIFNDNGNLLLNLRNVNYTLYHCENGQLYNNRYGPLAYLNPENDLTLRTWNYFCTLKEDLSIDSFRLIDTSQFDIPPVWTFIGLEDARLVRWYNKLYICGVRRDVKPNGEGRMEMSEIDNAKEISRTRIAPPNDPNSYCEKNWMPIIDLPFHFVKWSNPTEVVKVEGSKSQTVFLSDKVIPDLPALRGSSQVIPYKDYRICIVHECDLFYNQVKQKDATYLHRFIVWDKDWNIVYISDEFSFMTGEIEFCCGLALYQNDLLISFGFQDNAAYILKVPENQIESVIYAK